MTKKKSEKVYLIDASIYIFRAYYSISNELKCPQGNAVNAIYGFARFLIQLLSQTDPKHIAICFDESLAGNFRVKLYPPYKANRDPAPDDLIWQFQRCKLMAKALGISCFSSKRYEADDLIATIAAWCQSRGKCISVVSRDKDLLQVLKPGDEFWNFAEDEIVSYHDIAKVKGVNAEQIADFLAIAGDSVDNIPGANGIGVKTAMQLLSKFGSIEQMYENIEQVKSCKSIRGCQSVYQKLELEKENIKLYQRLTQLKNNIPLQMSLTRIKWRGVNSLAIKRLFAQLGFGERVNKLVLKLKSV